MIEAGFFVALLVGGYIFGRIAEQRHMKSIIQREGVNSALPAIASRHPPTDQPYHQHLVGGSVVIGSDYFKSFMSGLINIFGGRVTPFETLLDRARREAMLRMKEEAMQRNAAYIFNVKYDTTRIATGKVAAMEVFAYGTAMIPADKQLSSVSLPA